MSVLVVGRYTPEQLESIRMAIARAEHSASWATDALAARRMLMSAPPPSWLLIDASHVDIEPFARWVRSEARLFGVMIVAVAPNPSDRAFAEAIAAGCDDLVASGDLGAVTRRAATLQDYDPSARAPASQGGAVIAHPDDAQRRILGRVLRLAGFDVTFAADTGELVQHAAAAPKVMVLSDRLEGGAGGAIDAARAACAAETPCVVVGERASLRAPAAAVVSAHAPADHLLFVVNELLSPNLSNLRASRRVLWDAMCAFRPQGEHRPVFGLTYNLSHEGLYVRTLDPPTRGQRIWFELRPPHAPQAVHLRGDVMWVRKMSERPGGIVPPGFGVKIDASACPPRDLEQYHAAYEGLSKEWRLIA